MLQATAGTGTTADDASDAVKDGSGRYLLMEYILY